MRKIPTIKISKDIETGLKYLHGIDIQKEMDLFFEHETKNAIDGILITEEEYINNTNLDNIEFNKRECFIKAKIVGIIQEDGKIRVETLRKGYVKTLDSIEEFEEEYFVDLI